jgi:hypothetical protein
MASDSVQDVLAMEVAQTRPSGATESGSVAQMAGFKARRSALPQHDWAHSA